MKDEPKDGADVLRDAEQMIRRQHRADDPAYQFYTNIADHLNWMASRAKNGQIIMPSETRQLNRLVAAAYGYIDAFEKRQSNTAPRPCHYCNMFVERDTAGPGIHATHPSVKEPWKCPASINGKHFLVTLLPPHTSDCQPELGPDYCVGHE